MGIIICMAEFATYLDSPYFIGKPNKNNTIRKIIK
jgi:hypothetical protein